MKTFFSAKVNHEAGGALLLSLMITAILITLMGSYLNLLSSDAKSTSHSQQWNLCLPVAESGIEEALAHINLNGGTNLLVVHDISSGLLTDGWTSQNGVAVMRRTLPVGRYVVSISGTTGAYLIQSTGYYPSSRSATNELARTVTVATTNIPIFVKGLLVKKTITSNGNSVIADAFDSTNPLFSNTNGQYMSSKATNGGGIATLSTNATALNFGSATVYGPVATGPGGSINSSVWRIGTQAWLVANPGSGKIMPGWFTTDMNVTLPDVQPPSLGSYFTPSSGTAVYNGKTNSYNYVLSSGNYQISSGTVNGKMIVTGNATLYITSAASVNFSSSDSIIIAPGASLQLYVGSATANLPNVVNTGTATQFTYYGLPTNTKINQTVNADFTGNLYAPNADYTLGGNGLGYLQNISGAAVVNTMYYNDLFSFHYDAALASLGLSRGVVVNSWKEVDPSTATVH